MTRVAGVSSSRPRAERACEWAAFDVWLREFSAGPRSDDDLRELFATSEDQLLKAAALTTRWTRGHHPLLAADARAWCRMFDAVGFIAYFRPLESARPSSPVRAFRAATPEFADGMAWWVDRRAAELYVEYHRLRWPSVGTLSIYERTIEPADLLGVMPKLSWTTELAVRPVWVANRNPSMPSPQRTGTEEPQSPTWAGPLPAGGLAALRGAAGAPVTTLDPVTGAPIEER